MASHTPALMYTGPMNLNHDICYQALKTRDSRFDGQFFTGVSSTGIFCRPVCPASTPKTENCTFFPSASAALNAGYRPCLRCRPESAPTSPAWMGTEAIVRRAIRLIDEGALDEGHTLTDLCDRLGIGERHLRRLFQQYLGASPKQIALTRRLMFAKRLLIQTNAPITEIAMASGFNSLRRFNDAFKKAFDIPPSHGRKEDQKSNSSQDVTLHFSYHPPFDWDGLLDFFGSRAIDEIETVENETYRRTIKVDDSRGEISVSNDTVKNRLVARISNIPIEHLRIVSRKIRRMFDLDCNPELIANDLSQDEALRPVIEQKPGLRIPGTWNCFEVAVRAVIGQQISVKGARTICSRLVKRVGTGVFPSPQDIVDTDITGIGLTDRRVETLKNLAANWQDLNKAKPLEDNIKYLCSLKGIGPWTANYIVMRSLWEPDVYPVDDLGLIRGLEKLELPATKKDLAVRAESWRPWRAYGALYLWSVL